MKITQEQREEIRKRYERYRSNGYLKQTARRRISDELGVGLTTVWDHTYDVDELVENPPAPKKLVKPSWPQTYIITSWELRIGVDDKFVACLEQMAELYDAELLLVPCQKSDAKYLPEDLKEKFYVVTENIKFNSNLDLKYVETNALVQSPLAGHVGAYPDTTSIIPGLVKEMRTEPSQHYVKQVTSTGSIGYLNADISTYEGVEEDKDFLRKWRTVRSRSNGRPTAVAQNYIVPSALVVDVLDNKTFLTRFVSSHRSGVVYDLNKKFTPDGYEEIEPLALVVGDTHAYNANMSAVDATKEMIQMLNPREVVLNDFFDGMSLNHHEIGSAVKFNDVPSIEEEAVATRELLQEFCDLSNRVTYIQSNHDNFITTYLDGPTSYWRLNRNYEIACALQVYRLQTGKHPVESLLTFNRFKNLRFVTEKENHYIGKVLVKHGHEGIGGVRSGFFPLARTYNFYNQGHTHSPAVFRNAVCVGSTAELDLGYNIGGSAWLHANAIIHADNSQQLLPIINGVWIR